MCNVDSAIAKNYVIRLTLDRSSGMPVFNVDIHKVLMSAIVQGNLDKKSPRKDAGLLFSVIEQKRDKKKKEESILLIVQCKLHIDLKEIPGVLKILSSSFLKSSLSIAQEANVGVLAFSCNNTAQFMPLSELPLEEVESFGFSVPGRDNFSRKNSAERPSVIPDSSSREKIFERFAKKDVVLEEDSIVVTSRFQHRVKRKAKTSIPAISMHALVEVNEDTYEAFDNLIISGFGACLNYGLGIVLIESYDEYDKAVENDIFLPSLSFCIHGNLSASSCAHCLRLHSQ